MTEDKLKKTFYKAKKDGKGSAFQISTFRGKDGKGVEGAGDLVTMIDMAGQIGTNASGNATFGWKEGKKSIALTIEEVAQLSMVCRRLLPSISLFHDGAKRAAGGVVKTLKAEQKSYEKEGKKIEYIQVYLKQGDAELSIALSLPEAYLVAVLLDHIIVAGCVTAQTYQRAGEATPGDAHEGGFSTAGSPVTGPTDTFDPLDG